MLTARQGVRVLDPADLDAFLDLVSRDPVVNAFAEHRARTTNLEPKWLGGEMWGRFAGGDLVAACHVGANLVPIQCTAEDARTFAERALTRTRSISTIVGPTEPVAEFWQTVAGSWSQPREIRWRQPHLEIEVAPLVSPDLEVRRTIRSDLDALYPACVAMYSEEVGISPEAGGGADLYRARISQLISRGWSFAKFDDDGRLVFKAEVACSTSSAAQIQGVYVPPELRGQGIAVAGMAAVVALVQKSIAPVVSLYVNEWNGAARGAYERVGFRQTSMFSTVMF